MALFFLFTGRSMEQNLLMVCFNFLPHSVQKSQRQHLLRCHLPSGLLPVLALHFPGSITGETAKKLSRNPPFPNRNIDISAFCQPQLMAVCWGNVGLGLRVISTAFTPGSKRLATALQHFLWLFLGVAVHENSELGLNCRLRFIYEIPSSFRLSRPYISQPESQDDIHVEILSQLEILKDNLEPTGASFPPCNFSNIITFAHILHEPAPSLRSAYAGSHSPHPHCKLLNNTRKGLFLPRIL